MNSPWCLNTPMTERMWRLKLMLAKPIYQHWALAAVWSFLVDLSVELISIWQTLSWLSALKTHSTIVVFFAIFNVFIDITGKWNYQFTVSFLIVWDVNLWSQNLLSDQCNTLLFINKDPSTILIGHDKKFRHRQHSLMCHRLRQDRNVYYSLEINQKVILSKAEHFELTL